MTGIGFQPRQGRQLLATGGGRLGDRNPWNLESEETPEGRQSLPPLQGLAIVDLTTRGSGRRRDLHPWLTTIAPHGAKGGATAHLTN